MKKLVFEKKLAGPIATFLLGLNMKSNKQLSRLRTRVYDKFSDVDEQMQKDRIELLKEFAEKDEKGDIIKSDNGSFKVKEIAKAEKEVDILVNEQFAIEAGEYANNMQPLIDFLYSEDSEMELEGVNGLAYDRLLMAWEKAEEAEGE